MPIAGLANVAKNISYLAASASRAAIHRALSNRQGAANLGDLTAKSGSQTIVASLVGLGLGVGVSNACGGDVTTVWPAWAALSATHLTCTWLSLRYVADVELDPPRLAALVDAFLETGTCPTPAETSSAESLLVGGGDPSWLSVGDRVDAFPATAFGGNVKYVLHAEQDVARVLLEARGGVFEGQLGRHLRRVALLEAERARRRVRVVQANVLAAQPRKLRVRARPVVEHEAADATVQRVRIARRQRLEHGRERAAEVVGPAGGPWDCGDADEEPEEGRSGAVGRHFCGEIARHAISAPRGSAAICVGLLV